jgi:radical SAM-linked protein
LSVEVARGCTRGCRFCQACFLSRPVRERSPQAVCDTVAEGLAASGYDEVGLLSLSTGDYSSIGPLLVSLMDAHAAERVSISLPSLRADSLEQRLLDEVGRVRKTGFTLAPEAGTERLRQVVNKNLTDAEILVATERIFSAGWKAVKLYFMVGLPTETRDDWRGIVDLAHEVTRRAPGGRGRVVVSISNFVPKPHTPFQWCRQADAQQMREAQEFFKRTLRGKRIDFKWHNAEMSVLEGVLARGDRRLGTAILGAYHRGRRMDGWTDEFLWEPWREALAEAGRTPAEFLRERSPSETLPWDVVDVGVDRRYLVEEWEKAARGEATEDCRDGECRGCGLCDFEQVMPRVAAPEGYPERREPRSEAEPLDPAHASRLRFRFRKTGTASLLSHLETVAALHRAFRAAGVRLVYSQGFNPHPKLTLGPALRLGTESVAELGELRVWELPNLAETRGRANANLPEGLRVMAMWVIPVGCKGLTGGDAREEYRLQPTREAESAAVDRGGWGALVEVFRACREFPVVKRRVNKADRVLEAHEFVKSVTMDEEGIAVRMVRKPDGTTLGLEDFFRHLAGLPEGVRACARILKTRSDLL